MKVKTLYNNKIWTVDRIQGEWVRLVDPLRGNGYGSLTGYTWIKEDTVAEWIR